MAYREETFRGQRFFQSSDFTLMKKKQRKEKLWSCQSAACLGFTVVFKSRLGHVVCSERRSICSFPFQAWLCCSAEQTPSTQTSSASFFFFLFLRGEWLIIIKEMHSSRSATIMRLIRLHFTKIYDLLT